MPSNQPQLPPFLRLPTEIRLQIYALVLPRGLRLRFRPHRRTHKNRSWRQPATRTLTPLSASRHDKISLLLACRLLHRETAALFYGQNKFILEVDQYSFTSTLRREVLGLMQDVEIRDLNFGRASAWYQGRLGHVLGREIAPPGDGIALSGLKALTLSLEGTDSVAGRAREVLVRFLREAGAGTLSWVVVTCRPDKGRKVMALVECELGDKWVKRWERTGDFLWWRGKFRLGVGVTWAKRGLEGELRDTRL